MKQVLLTIGLCFAAASMFAQKSAVSNAERIIKDSKPDFNEARNLIKGAMEDATTKDDAKTWYVAGQIEDAQFSAENTKQILGQQPDEPVMYEALGNIVPYFLKAYDLDGQPNEKGKIKPRYQKNIKSTISANHIYYINGGAYYFDQRDYKKALGFFDQYINISNLPLFKGEKTAARDSNYMMCQYYAAVAAMQVEDSKLAIEKLNRAKDTPFRQYDVYQYLCFEYEQAKDSVNLEKVLKEGMQVFPDSSYYLLSLINLYIYSDRNSDAVDLLTTAIAQQPGNSQLYHAMGSVYESGLKQPEKAEEYYTKAIELDPENPVALFNLGRIFYNQGVNKLGEANLISDVKKYNEEKELAKGFFKKALPHFEKALQLKPNEREYMVGLRGIYYNLDMNKEFDDIEAKMNDE
ncbi:MAG: tetratricopeptide repeat protein [Tannerella sp.]|jgi:tetratricopeptide (TPR) repeat protein|nr:tetratricopeptide repeat protein [Tannerella sp.]